MRRPPANHQADPPPLDEETAERLLAGDLPPALAPPGYAEVAALLAATVAPPTPQELAGEQAALAELRAVTRARAADTAPRRARPRRAVTRRAGPPRRRRRVGLAAVAVAGALATGGAAAAASGHLPAPVREAARTILAPVGGGPPATPTHPAATPSTPAAGPGVGGTGQPGQGPRPTGPAATRADPAATPDLDGLCQAYAAGKGSEQGKKLDATAFETLARAAGGEDKVAAYCQALQPGTTKPGKAEPPRPDDPGAGNGQGGPPPDPGSGNQGQPTPPSRPSQGR